MKKSAPLIALLVLAVSCSSLPKLSLARKSSDDCIVLFRTTLVNKDKVNTVRRYFVSFSNGTKDLLIPTDAESYVALIVREPGVKLVGLRSDVDKTRATGDKFEVPLDFDLPYQPGDIVVADYTFVQTYTRKDERNITTDFDFVKTTDSEKASLISSFRQKFSLTRDGKTW